MKPGTTALDEYIFRLQAAVREHHDPLHPERTSEMQGMLKHALMCRDAMTPVPPIRVEKSDFLAPDEAVFPVVPGVWSLGRFAWSRLMRTLRAPWPEAALEPDQDFPRDAPPGALP